MLQPRCQTLRAMKVIILGAGIIGTSTAWHLLQLGHDVTVVDRQPDAALETSFANAAQISVSYCEPWANKHAPLKALKWMFDKEAPLLLRPHADPQQWRWLTQFLAECNDRSFARNVQQIVALGAYSHSALKAVVAQTGIEFNRLERGIAHFFTSDEAVQDAQMAVDLMREYGVNRRMVSTEEFLKIEPAFKPYAAHIKGGTFTESDESGDARVFTQKLAQLCAQGGVQFLYNHRVERLNVAGGAIDSVTVRATAAGADSRPRTLQGDAVIVACGSYTAPLLRTVGLNVAIYPGKGYSATLPILKPEAAPFVSCIDDGNKLAMSRLGNQLRVAGTIELNGFDSSLDSPLAKARCHMLARRIEELMPGVCDTRLPEQGGNPQFWTGLRPATPTNIPFIGRTKIGKLWINAGHGTLGWTHGAGSGKAMAELVSGRMPDMQFGFYGFEGEAQQIAAAY
ncbi:D-amino acid dehydrogenase [Comamonas sp. SY3]|uniref:D-amino acid dehydrogenase n=1 Tax=Comamonas sp. SY3 TaxID=3243601 RepID=UPI0035947EB4